MLISKTSVIHENQKIDASEQHPVQHDVFAVGMLTGGKTKTSIQGTGNRAGGQVEVEVTQTESSTEESDATAEAPEPQPATGSKKSRLLR